MTLLMLSLSSLQGEVAESIPIGIEVLDSGPWDQSYSALEAPKTKSWIRFRSAAMASFAAGDRLRFWLQWAPGPDGPWKVHSKGEMELRHPNAVAKSGEHSNIKTRGYVLKAADNDDVAMLEMNPLPTSRWLEEGLPYFRIAQAVRKPGSKWVKAPKKMLAPEDNNASYSLPFQALLDIVYVYLPDKGKDAKHLSFATTTIHPDQPGPWATPSFKQGSLPYVSFFLALGGTNVGTVIPTHLLTTEGPAGHLEFWSCRAKPKGYRGTPVDDSSLDSLWWGVAPVRIPLPPPGESATLLVTTQLYGDLYNKRFTVYGRPATPERLAERKVNQARYHNLIRRTDPSTPVPKGSLGEVADAKRRAIAIFQQQRELYRERGDEEADALADAYIAVLKEQQDEYLLRRANHPHHPEDDASDTLRDLLSAIAIAEELQDWVSMKEQLDAFINKLDDYQANGTLTRQDRAHYIFSQFGLRSLEPFQKGMTRGSFLDLLKEWAWTLSSPETYAQALAIKQSLLVGQPSQPRSADDYVTPHEYRELAELTMERTGNRDKAEEYWRKADQLLLDPDSPFYHPKADEGKLHMQRPGWWPE